MAIGADVGCTETLNFLYHPFRLFHSLIITGTGIPFSTELRTRFIFKLAKGYLIMRKIDLLCGALAASLTLASAPAAAITDTIQSPSGFFVPSDAQVLNSPYYRGANEDWQWQHNAIGSSFTSASLNISAYDVDFAQGERDEIFAMDGMSWVSLGYLTGTNNAWEFGNAFALGANFFDDIASGLKVRIDIDTTNAGWVVTLGKSSLSLDGSVLPPPTPGVPEPTTWAMLIAGFGLVGAMARRRRQVSVAA